MSTWRNGQGWRSIASRHQPAYPTGRIDSCRRKCITPQFYKGCCVNRLSAQCVAEAPPNEPTGELLVVATNPVNRTVSQPPQLGIVKEVPELWTFEMLLAELSAIFINLPADEVDRGIEDAQRRICEHLHIDHSSLWQSSHDEQGGLLLTHIYRGKSLPPVPNRMSANAQFPWVLRTFMRKEIICIPSQRESESVITQSIGETPLHCSRSDSVTGCIDNNDKQPRIKRA